MIDLQMHNSNPSIPNFIDRKRLFEQVERSLVNLEFDESRLIIFRGIPGSGLTTFANGLKHRLDGLDEQNLTYCVLELREEDPVINHLMRIASGFFRSVLRTSPQSQDVSKKFECFFYGAYKYLKEDKTSPDIVLPRGTKIEKAVNVGIEVTDTISSTMSWLQALFESEAAPIGHLNYFRHFYNFAKDSSFVSKMEENPLIQKLSYADEKGCIDTLITLLVEALNETKSTKSLLVIDNIQSIYKNEFKSNVIFSSGWITELIIKLKSNLTVLLGNEFNANSVIKASKKNRSATRLSVDCDIDISELTPSERTTFVSRYQFPQDMVFYLTQECKGNIELLKGQCDFVEGRLKNGLSTDISSVPLTLPNLYEKFTGNFDKHSKQLIEVLALFKHFDEQIAVRFSNALDLLINHSVIQRIQSRTTESQMFFNTKCFIPSFAEHVLYPVNNTIRDGLSFSSKQILTVFEIYIETYFQSTSDKSYEFGSAIIHVMTVAEKFAQLLPGMDSEDFLSRVYTVVLDVASENLIVLEKEYLPNQSLWHVEILSRHISSYLMKLEENSNVNLTRLLTYLIRFVSRGAKSLYEKWGDSDPEQAVKVLELPVKLMQSNIVAVENINQVDSVLLELHYIRSSYRLAPDSDLGININSQEVYLSSLKNILEKLQFEQFLKDSEGTKSKNILLQTLEIAEITHYVSRVLSRRHYVDEAESFYDVANSILKQLQLAITQSVDEDFYNEFLELYKFLNIKVALYRVNDKNIPTPILMDCYKQLKAYIDQDIISPTILNMWVRTLIRISIKWYCGEDSTKRVRDSIETPIDTASKLLIDIILASPHGNPISESAIRNLLRVERKRNLLNLKSFTNQISLGKALEEISKNLCLCSNSQFKMIVKEMVSSTNYGEEYSNIVLKSLFKTYATLPPNRTKILLEELESLALKSCTSEEITNGITNFLMYIAGGEKGVRDISLNALIKFKKLVFEQVFSDVAISLLKGEMYEIHHYKLKEIIDFYCSLSRDEARKILRRLLSLMEQIAAKGDVRTETLSRLYSEFSNYSIRFSPEELSLYLEFLKFYKDEIVSHTQGNKSECKRKIKEIINLINTKNKFSQLKYSAEIFTNNFGKQLAFEVFASAEAESVDIEILKWTRQYFAENFLARLDDVNSKSCISSAINSGNFDGYYDAFLSSDKKYLAQNFLKMIYEHRVSGFDVGSILVCKIEEFSSCRKDNYISFTYHGKEIKVKDGDFFDQETKTFKEYQLASRRLASYLSKYIDDQNIQKPGNYFLMQLNQIDNEGYWATMVGQEYIVNILELFFPGLRYSKQWKQGKLLFLGGSRAKGVVRLEKRTHDLLVSGGRNVNDLLCSLLNLRTFTSIPIPYYFDTKPLESELRSYVKSTFRDLNIIEVNEDRLHVKLKKSITKDQRTKRTWRSLFNKVYPCVVLTYQGLELVEENEIDEDQLGMVDRQYSKVELNKPQPSESVGFFDF